MSLLLVLFKATGGYNRNQNFEETTITQVSGHHLYKGQNSFYIIYAFLQIEEKFLAENHRLKEETEAKKMSLKDNLLASISA